ncbi:MAG: ExeM/NucH family extracellular endonuclease [Planctomycetota bacterium]
MKSASILMPTLVLVACVGCRPDVSDSDVADEALALSAEPGSTLAPPESGDVSVSTPAGETQSYDEQEAYLVEGDLDAVDWRSLVGQTVAIDGELVVVDTYDLMRRGQVKVARSRLYIPTESIDPNDADPLGNSHVGGSNVAAVTKAQEYNDTAVVTLDDGSADQNIFPPVLFPELGADQASLRVGSVIRNVSGKLVQAGSNLLLVPDGPLDCKPAPRPEVPDVGDAAVKVASFNVLNYFTTIDDGDNNARGADSDKEFERQEAKIVAAMVAMDADVIGLMELENSLEAEESLVAAINDALGQNAYKACGLPDDFRSAPGGGDAIRVGIIYRPDRVDLVGSVSVIRDGAFGNARAPVVQSFQPKADGETFTVIVNHFKSKGGSGDADAANKNKGDGQAAYNAARRGQALAICEYIEGIREQDSDSRVLVIGDLNAYAQEDPIDALRASGLVDLHELGAETDSATAGSTKPYSFIYYGQSGSLDHALATQTLADDVTGIAAWHINADEPRFLDYNQEFNPPNLYRDDPFRSSDHDPVLIGIRSK